MPNIIFNAFGKPAEFRGNNTAYTSPTHKKQKYQPSMADDSVRQLSQSAHREMLTDSRRIANWPIVRGMVRQKADYVSAAGWIPHFVGSDDTWGANAEQVLTEALKIVDARGAQFSFETDMRIACETLDVDGDFFVLLGETVTGFPRLQFIEAHRVGNRGENKVKSGRWEGSLMVNGVVYDEAGAEVAYNLLGNKPDDDKIIEATDMIRVADPVRFTEGRPLSPVSFAVHDLYDLKATRDAEKIAQRANAALTLIESNETGTDDPAGQWGLNGSKTANGLEVQELDDGLYRFIKNGSKIEAHQSNRPSAGSRQFEQDLLMGCALGMQWRLEMLDLSKLGGAGVRGFQDNINTAILSRFRVLKRFGLRLIQYIVAKLIKRGDLPPSVDWWRWDFCQPPEFTVDAGRSIQSDIDAIRAGLDSEESIVRSRLGMTYADFLKARANAAKLKKRIAEQAGLEMWELGYVTRPGDMQQQVAQPAVEPDDDEPGDNQDPQDKNDPQDGQQQDTSK